MSLMSVSTTRFDEASGLQTAHETLFLGPLQGLLEVKPQGVYRSALHALRRAVTVTTGLNRAGRSLERSQCVAQWVRLHGRNRRPGTLLPDSSNLSCCCGDPTQSNLWHQGVGTARRGFFQQPHGFFNSPHWVGFAFSCSHTRFSLRGTGGRADALLDKLGFVLSQQVTYMSRDVCRALGEASNKLLLREAVGVTACALRDPHRAIQRQGVTAFLDMHEVASMVCIHRIATARPHR